MEATKPMTIFWLVKSTPEWLQMPPSGTGGRFEFAEKTFKPILRKYSGVALRFFDAEAYSSSCSDVMMWTVADANQYHAMVEDLRETPFWDRYFQICHIVPAFEDQYADHYEQAKLNEETRQTVSAA